MNLKNICCLALLTSFSINAYAIQSYKCKVISQKIWTSDGSPARVTLNHKNLPMPIMKHNEKNAKHTLVSLESAVGKLGEPVQLSNNHYMYVYNAGDKTELYSVRHTICSQTSEATEECVFYHKNIEIEVGGSYYDDTSPLLSLKFKKPGHYSTTASTAVFLEREMGEPLAVSGSDAGASIDIV